MTTTSNSFQTYKTGHWLNDEDERCKLAVQQELQRLGSWESFLATDVITKKLKWTAVSQLVLTRSSKQCRERWLNHLSPNINRSPWNQAEDRQLFRLYAEHPRCWSVIARKLNRRTQNQVKSRWRFLNRHALSFHSVDESNKRQKTEQNSIEITNQPSSTQDIYAKFVESDCISLAMTDFDFLLDDYLHNEPES